ncbi:MAG: PQQ-binding-like beta-propeller repeat protein [Armatimonadota bacterium]|nr:PQQ-binding-like beta-propeller repeat protein [Armatimonadota bacterium]MDR5704267.1 PQQ-binding-like beta-propeller repeat protein [Armatimonadota bacterium]
MRKAPFLILIVFSLLFLGETTTGAEESAWPLFGYDLVHTNFNPVEKRINSASVPHMQVAWRLQADGPVHMPVVDREIAYFGSWAGTFYAVEVSTGKVRWRITTETYPEPRYGFPTLGVTATAAVQDGRIYFPTALARVWCVDARTGKVLWRQAIGNPKADDISWSSPVVHRGRVYIGVSSRSDHPTQKGKVVALDARTGKILWTFSTVTYATPEWDAGGSGVTSTPTLDPRRNVLYITTGNPRSPTKELPPGPNLYSESILALDARTGRKLWHYQATPRDPLDLDFIASANLFTIRKNGTAIQVVGAGKKDGFYYLVDAETGRLIYKKALGTKEYGATIMGDAALAHGRLYLGVTLFSPQGPRGKMAALEPATGRVLWERPLLAHTFNRPTAAGDVVFLGDYKGNLYAFEMASGKLLWHRAMGGRIGPRGKDGVTVAAGVVLVPLGYPANVLAALRPSLR